MFSKEVVGEEMFLCPLETNQDEQGEEPGDCELWPLVCCLIENSCEVLTGVWLFTPDRRSVSSFGRNTGKEQGEGHLCWFPLQLLSQTLCRGFVLLVFKC